MKHFATKTLVKTLVAVAALAAGSATYAQQNTFTIGFAAINVNSSSPALKGPFTPPGSGIDVADKSTLVFGYIREIAPNIEIELALGVPPTHNINGTGALAGFGTITRVKQLAPTVFVNYRFGKTGDTLRPFVGIGANYTKFTGTSTAAGNAASGGPTKIELSDSTGLAAHAGLTYALSGNMSITAAVAMADVKTDLKATTNGVIIRKTSIDLRPVVVSFSVGYSF